MKSNFLFQMSTVLSLATKVVTRLHSRIYSKTSFSATSTRIMSKISFSSTRIMQSSSSNINFKPSKNFIDFPFKYHEEIELSIVDLTNLGIGLGRSKLSSGEDWVVMVPFTLPAERVVCRVYRNYASYSEAELVRVIQESPDRKQPECKYFGECGGCQYQHLKVSQQREWKNKQVEDALTRIAGFSEVVVNPVIGSDEFYGYRSKVLFKGILKKKNAYFRILFFKITPHYDAIKPGQDFKIG